MVAVPCVIQGELEEGEPYYNEGSVAEVVDAALTVVLNVLP